VGINGYFSSITWFDNLLIVNFQKSFEFLLEFIFSFYRDMMK